MTQSAPETGNNDGACVALGPLHALGHGPGRLLGDVEFRTYAAILAAATVLAAVFGLSYGDFGSFGEAIRYSLFQVTSILTNTGFTTHDFDGWNQFNRGLLFFLKFVGGCAGSTSCSIKVIRYLILVKALSLHTEKVYHPSVVRQLRLNGEPVEPDVVRDVVAYFKPSFPGGHAGASRTPARPAFATLHFYRPVLPLPVIQPESGVYST